MPCSQCFTAQNQLDGQLGGEPASCREQSFHQDPEATHVVLSEVRGLTLLPLEVGLSHKVPFVSTQCSFFLISKMHNKII